MTTSITGWSRDAGDRRRLAWATCELRELIAGGDHTIAIGAVKSMGLGGGEPLLWYAGRYHALPSST